jgi:pyruvate,water dikinase
MAYILPIHKTSKTDFETAGAKAVSLGELAQKGIPVPDGFVVTNLAFEETLSKNLLKEKIEQALEALDRSNPTNVSQVSHLITQLIYSTQIPDSVRKKIYTAYDQMGSVFSNVNVAVRTSLPSEKISIGEMPLFLNVSGDASLITAIKKIWAWQFSPYNLTLKNKPFSSLPAVIIQRMINAEVSGFLHTASLRGGNKHFFEIEAVWGLGEIFNREKIKPDLYVLEKNSLKLEKVRIKTQEIYLTRAGAKTVEKEVPKKFQDKRKLSDRQLLLLGEIGKKIAKIHYYPQTAEWVLYHDQIYVVQTQHLINEMEDVKASNSHLTAQSSEGEESVLDLPVVAKGVGVCQGIVSGKVQFIDSINDRNLIDPGEIIVLEDLTYEMFPMVKMAKGIICEKGGLGSAASILARELGVPCVMGVEKAKEILKPTQVISINGKQGLIYNGSPTLTSKNLEYSRDFDKYFEGDKSPYQIKLKPFKTATNIYLDLPSGSWDKNFGELNFDGIGLIRGEYIYGEKGIHPKKLITDKKREFLVNLIAEKLIKAGEESKGKDIYYQFSDLHSGYKLNGGEYYETKELNPIAGFRGAMRHLYNHDILDVEIEALKKARVEFSHIYPVVPFCRSFTEFERFKKLLSRESLAGHTIKLGLSANTPSNLILAPQFVKAGIDTFFINLNEITTFTLGVDGSNTDVNNLFDTTNESIIWLIQHASNYLSQKDIEVIVCGESAGLYPHFVYQLIRAGVTGFSISADNLESCRRMTHLAEKRVVNKK